MRTILQLDSYSSIVQYKNRGMPSIGCQTQQFLTLLEHSEKLTALYLRIKGYQSEKQELLNKIQYMEFKNQALEKSLFEHQLRSRERQSIKNSILIHEVIGLEEQIHKENSNNPQYSRREDSKKQSKDRNKHSRQKVQQSKMKNGLIPIIEQPEIQNAASSQVLQPKSTNIVTSKSTNQNTSLAKPSPTVTSHRSQNINTNGPVHNSLGSKSSLAKPDHTMTNSTTSAQSHNSVNNSSVSSVANNENRDSRDRHDALMERVSTLEKQLVKHEKSKKITEVEIKRLRKMNEQYASKCKRLEKLVQARNELYSNLKRDEAYLNNEICVGVSFNGVLLGDEDQDSLFQ